MIHGFLPQCAKAAFPRWEDAAEPVHAPDADEDDIEVLRRKNRNKTYRLVKCTNDKRTQIVFVCTNWVSVPLDHLLQRVQYLSARHDALLYLVSDRGNPFKEAHEKFAAMMSKQLVQSSLRTPFWFFNYSDESIDFCRDLTLSCDSQMYWRFLELGSSDIICCMPLRFDTSF